jgi:hypothetical protein
LVVAPPLLAIEEPTAAMVTVPPVGAKVILEFTVKVPYTEKLAVGCVAGVEAIVRPENLIVPGVAAIVNVVALIVTVPPVDVSKVEVEGTVRVLAMLKFEELVTLEDVARARLKNVGAEPEVTIDEPVFKVIVPPVGAKAAVVVKTPATVAVEVADVMAAEIFRPPAPALP